jgi:hypothetical protein
MLRTLPIIAALLLLSSVAWGAGEVCTLATGAQTIGPIGTVTGDAGSGAGNCGEAARVPDGDDFIVMPDGLTLTVTQSLTWLTGGALVCRSGAKLVIDNATATSRVVLTFVDGADGVVTLQGALDNVAIYQEPGCEFDFDAGYVEWGKAAPGIAAEHTSTNDTTAQVGWIWECYGGAGAHDTPFGTGSCITAGFDEITSFFYDSSIHNPDAAGAGNTYLSESLIVADPGMLVCGERSTAWSGHCYAISAIDSSAVADYDMSVRINQNSAALSGLERSEDPADVLSAVRELEEMELRSSINPGDICISVDDAEIASDGIYAGRWVRLPGDYGGKPYKIAMTDADADCDNNAAGDAIWLDAKGSTLNAIQIVGSIADTDSIVVGYEFANGDDYYIMSQVSIEATPNAADGDALIILEGTNNWEGVRVIGSGLTHFYGAVLNGSRNHWLAGGADGGPMVKFEDMNQVRLVDSSFVSGGVVGGADGIELAGITGGTYFENVAFRYLGGDAIMTSDGTAAFGAGSMKMVKCESVGTGAAIDPIAGCIKNDDFPHLAVSQLVMSDAVHGAAGDGLWSPAGYLMGVNGFSVWGQIQGGITHGLYAAGITASNLLARGAGSNRTAGTQGYLPVQLYGADIGLYYCAACAGPINVSQGGDLQGIVIYNSVTANDQLLYLNGYGTMSNILIYLPITTDTSDTYVILVASDDSSTTDPIIEYVTVAWPLNTAGEWIRAIGDTGTTTNEDAFYFGSIIVRGMYGADLNVAYTAIDLSTGLIGVINDRAGGIFVSDSTLTAAGTGSMTYVDDFATYTTPPYLARTPNFLREGEGKLTLIENSVVDVLGGGTRTGPQEAGFNPAGFDWMMRQLGVDHGRRTALLKPPRSLAR